MATPHGSPDRARSEVVRSELAAWGAPFWSRPANATLGASSLEELLAQACELAHSDASVAKVLPYVFLRNRKALHFDRLERVLAEREQKHTGGFLLAVAAALAGSLSGDKTMSAWSKRLKDKRRTKPVDFFPEASSKRLQALAERNTPALARAWNFRLNMSMDDFRSVMDKFPLDGHLRGCNGRRQGAVGRRHAPSQRTRADGAALTEPQVRR